MTGWIIFGCIVLFLIWAFTRFVTVTAVYDYDPTVWVKILFFTVFRLPEDPVRKKRKAEKKAAKEKKRAAKEMKMVELQKRKAEKHTPRSEPAQINSGENAEETAKAAVSAAPESRDDETKAAPEAAKKAKKDKPKKKKKGGMPAISVDMIRDYLKSASPPIKRFFRKIRIRDVYIDYVVGSDDAAKTALKYGGLCAGIYSAAELLCEFTDTKVKEINIEADFSAEKDDIFAYGVVKLRISTALGCALWLGFRVLKTYLSYNKKPTEKPKAQRPRPARASAE